MDTQVTEYKTDNMALAVFLNLKGHNHCRLERGARGCLWVFIVVGLCMHDVASFLDGHGEADVEDTLKVSKAVREEMYDFMKGSR